MRDSNNKQKPKDYPLILLWTLGILLILFVALSVVLFNKVNEDSSTLIKVIFSSETLVSITVGMAAIYSWRYNKKLSEYELSNSKYENTLQILKDVDSVLSFYKGSEEQQDISVVFQDFLKNKDFDKEKFLELYHSYVLSKVEPYEDSKIEPNIDKVKKAISNYYKVPNKNIRYSKNYEPASVKYNLKWTTWYSLRKSFIDGIGNDEKIIFLTSVNNNYIAISLTGETIKKLSSEMQPRNSKNGDPQFDFYLSEKQSGDYVENRNNISLMRDKVEKLNLNFLENQS